MFHSMGHHFSLFFAGIGETMVLSMPIRYGKVEELISSAVAEWLVVVLIGKKNTVFRMLLPHDIANMLRTIYW